MFEDFQKKTKVDFEGHSFMESYAFYTNQTNVTITTITSSWMDV